MNALLKVKEIPASNRDFHVAARQSEGPVTKAQQHQNGCPHYGYSAIAIAQMQKQQLQM